MGSPREKWQRTLSKVISANKSKDLSTSTLPEEDNGNETSEFEVEAYFQRLKSRTSMTNLWSGRTFKEIVENDQTPDISTESDDDLDAKMSNTLKNLRQLRLDSDEDELRKDYIGEEILDKSERSESSDESINLMDNVHFAELEVNEVDLTDDSKTETSKDYLPRLHLTNFVETSPSTTKSFHESLSATHVSKSLEKEAENLKVFGYETNSDVDSMLSEIHSIQLTQSESTKNDGSRGTKVHSHSGNSKSDSSYSKHRRNSSSRSSPSKSSNQNRSIRSSKGTGSSSASKLTSNGSNKSTSKSFASDTSDSGHTLSNQSKTASSSSTSRNPSSISSNSFSSRDHRKKSGKRKEKRETHTQKDVGTQTQTKRWSRDDLTNEVINFRYDWQRRDPNCIAAHVINPSAIEVLTTYNPSILAANDLMKFHMQLLQQHIENNRRLYKAYAEEGVNNDYKYTTVEDTKTYINRNKPKVICYEDALRIEKAE